MFGSPLVLGASAEGLWSVVLGIDLTVNPATLQVAVLFWGLSASLCADH